MIVTRVFPTCLVLASLWAATRAGEDSPLRRPGRKPFFQLREHRTEYAGPGREDPAPELAGEILIGYFGPSDPAHPEGGDLWRAAELAVERANREGGYRGKPFRLVPAWSENPWGSGVGRVARMAYDDKVWAIVGGIDGPSTHLAEQVVAKARLVLISPASSDKTVNLANVPWMFSCLPGDHLQAPVLAEEISRRVGRKPFVLVSAVDHDSRLFAAELGKCLVKRRIGPRYHFKWKPGAGDLNELAAKTVEAKPGAVVLIAGPEASARMVVALRGRGFSGPVFGGPAMGRRRFVEEAGAAADGVLFPLLYRPREAPGEFADGFSRRFGSQPDYAAAHTYDAVRLLTAAIRKAGLNRARIRDAVGELSPYSGVTGKITWDPLGSNTRPVGLGTIRDGRVLPVHRASQDADRSPDVTERDAPDRERAIETGRPRVTSRRGHLGPVNRHIIDRQGGVAAPESVAVEDSLVAPTPCGLV